MAFGFFKNGSNLTPEEIQRREIEAELNLQRKRLMSASKNAVDGFIKSSPPVKWVESHPWISAGACILTGVWVGFEWSHRRQGRRLMKLDPKDQTITSTNPPRVTPDVAPFHPADQIINVGESS